MNVKRSFITALMVASGLLVALPGLAQAHDDDHGRVGISFSVGAPAYYGPPAYVYTPPPRVYYAPPRPVYYDNNYNEYSPRHEHWRGHGRGHWHHHEDDDDD
ncbi:MAG: hypothetical protein ABIT70_14170 [Sulfuriferula sp.]